MPATLARTLPAALLLAALLAPRPALAQATEPPPGFEGATITLKPDARVPLATEFRDEEGHAVRLGDFFHPGRPVLLSMIYCRCPSLCNLTLNGVAEAVRPLELLPGREFEIVTVDFDPREDYTLAAAKKASYIKLLGKPAAEAGWHFLTSSDPAAAKSVGEAVGFGYKLDPKGEQYLHQTAIYICTPEGRVARTLLGVTYDTDVLRISLAQASQGKIGLGWLGVALSCGLVHLDAATGKYIWAATALMRLTGIATVVLLGAVIGTLIYREARKGTP